MVNFISLIPSLPYFLHLKLYICFLDKFQILFASTAFFDGTQLQEQKELVVRDSTKTQYFLSCIRRADGQGEVFCARDGGVYETPSFRETFVSWHRFIVKTGKFLLTFLKEIQRRQSASHLEKIQNIQLAQ